MAEFVTVTTDDEGVATIRLDRAPVNALNTQIFAELSEAALQVTRDDAVGAVVIWGGPKVFAAGADIKEMAGRDFQDFYAHGGAIQSAFALLAAIPKVVIAAVNGYALGGGCELAMTADFRYAAQNAQFGQPEILLGTIPGAGGTQRLPRLVGLSKAKEIVYSGRFYSAQESEAFGLVDRVLPPEEVYDAAVADARRYAAGPYALRMAKQAIDMGAQMDLETALRLESSLFAATFATEDRATGMASFVEHGPGKAQFKRR